MRIRQVKPEFWRDARLAALSPSVRLFYIGLWCIADDAGWFDNDASQIACDLYPYESVKVRERHVTEMLGELVRTGRVTVHDCGHAEVPSLARHQRVGGRPVYTVRNEHARACAQMRADAPDGIGTVGNGRGTVGDGTERNVTVGASEFRQKAGWSGAR